MRYSEVFNIWNPQAALLLRKRVFIQEKLDGSQFRAHFDTEGVQCFSQRKPLSGVIPDLFRPAVETARRLVGTVPRGFVLFGEAICRPKHNLLTYGRAPQGGLVVFNVVDANTSYWLTPEQIAEKCLQWGLEWVPTDAHATPLCWDELQEFTDHPSMLGGAREGVVIKPATYGDAIDPRSDLPVMVKLVRPEFRERHGATTAKEKADRSPGAWIEQAANELRTEARWAKAVQRLLNEGVLVNDMKDMPQLIAEVQADVLKEEELRLREWLWTKFWTHLKPKLVAGLAEWYKAHLVAKHCPKD